MKHPIPQPRATRLSFLARAFAALGTLGLAACVMEASAHARLATLEVFDRDTGRLAPSYYKDGQQFVPGRPGARYALRVRNLTTERVMVVLSVDGVNVVTGQTANWNQNGYVLDPGASYDVNGWRKSNTEVAAFEFAALENSYAAKTGRPDNVGTLGMAVFRERPVVPVTPPAILLPSPQRLNHSDAAAPASSGVPQEAAKSKNLAEGRLAEKLGTAHGAREWSVVRNTEFTRLNSTPDNLVEINYDSYDRLVAAGVIQRPYANHRAQPFPANSTGFVADPPTN